MRERKRAIQIEIKSNAPIVVLPHLERHTKNTHNRMRSRIYLHLTRKRIQILRKKNYLLNVSLVFCNANQKQRCGTQQLRHKCAFCFMTKYVNTTSFSIHHNERRKNGERVEKRVISFDFISLKSHKSTTVSGKYHFQFVEFCWHCG